MNVNKNSLSLLVLPIFVAIALGYGTIPVRNKGNSITVEEYEKLEFCDSKLCLSDANRILQEVSYNDSVLPCESFDEFACGTFYKDRAYNERYEYVGFLRNYELLIDEQRHKVLIAPAKEDDGKAVKVAKNFYKRCVTSSE